MKKLIATIALMAICANGAAQATTYSIHVNLKKCKVQVYEQQNDEWKLIGTKKCCPGTKNKTPTGSMTITKKKSSFTHGDAKYNYVSYFSGKCAFHSTPCIDGEYDNSSLGHHRSGGCVRLEPEAAKWIYKYCDCGTEVIIK